MGGATDIGRMSGVKLRVRMKLSKGTGTLVDPQTEELQREYMGLNRR